MTPRTDRAPRQRLDVATRRAAILDAATAAFDAEPYASVSVAVVAAGAGASEALVYRYFGTKAGLYAEVVRTGLQRLAARRHEALDALPPHSSARDRVTATLVLHLDHVADHRMTWSAPFVTGNEPPESLAVRSEARAAHVAELHALLRPADWTRHTYALWGFFGFLDGACLHWVEAGCPQDDRWPLVEAVLGALEGALGDWAR